MDLPDLSTVDFTIVRKRGYNPQEVDRFLEVLDAELRRAEAEIRLLERRVAEVETASGSEAADAVTVAETSQAVAEAKERLLARSRAAAAAIIESAYRHAGVVDPDALPADLDQQVRNEVEALLARPGGSQAELDRGSTEPVESAHRQAKRFLQNAQLEADRIVSAARAEHQGLVARIARLQDLESQLDGTGSTGVVPLRGRGVIVDLTGEEPVVTVTESDVDDEAAPPRPVPADSDDRTSRYTSRSAGLPSLGDAEASAAIADLSALRPSTEED